MTWNDLENYRFRLLLLGLVTLVSVQVMSEPGNRVLGPVGVLAVASMLFGLSGERWVFWTALLLALVSTGGVVGGDTAEIAGSGFHAPLFWFAAAVITTRVLRSEKADEDAIVGSLCAYLLIALAFTSLYAGLEAAHPGSFGFDQSHANSRLFDDLFYFSFVTITTLGYGDITPVANAAIALVTLESVIGILFPTFVVARIVSLATTGGGRPFARKDVGLVSRPGRFELLVGIGVLGLLIAPFPEPTGLGGILLNLLATALMLSALYAATPRALGRILGIGLAAGALISSWWPTPAGTRLESIGLAFEFAFFCLVIGELLVWLYHERQVTRDVLLAGIGLYLLIGFAWASAFQLVESIAPGSILRPDVVAFRPGHLTYYSFMTLTTTGFGDFSPVTPVAERLAALEGLVGVFYPAVMVARLVSLYQSE